MKHNPFNCDPNGRRSEYLVPNDWHVLCSLKINMYNNKKEKKCFL